MAQDPTIYPTSYWPSGDVYPLTPPWSEYHAPQSITANPLDEQNAWLDIVVAQGAPFFTVLTFTDLGTDLTSTADDTTPMAFPSTASRIWRSGYGFNISKQFTLTLGAKTVPVYGRVWDGTMTVSMSVEQMAALGTNVLWNYSVNAWMIDAETAAPFTVCGMMGTIVVRPGPQVPSIPSGTPPDADIIIDAGTV